MTRSTLHRSKAEPIGETPAVVSEKSDAAPVDLMLDAEELDNLHAALITGLSSMGEIRRVRGMAEALNRTVELHQYHMLPADHEDGESIAEFCAALQAVYRAQKQLRHALEAR